MDAQLPTSFHRKVAPHEGPIRMICTFGQLDAIPELFGGPGVFLPKHRDHLVALDAMPRPVLGNGTREQRP